MKAAGVVLIVFTAANALVSTTQCPRAPEPGDPLRDCRPRSWLGSSRAGRVFGRISRTGPGSAALQCGCLW